ncbi:molybdopterin-binding/glycosyltransferase family 2 protein [Rhodopila sp.]|jgi:molybdenum cofactor cytidylyltransferase|uniref:molybdopterin-binding/glycosyltransferase family 2 protein n=1 Tax=Rhodopila sp. TaxID=2480087 RepID=UPI002B98D34A|nr:molybdopterin-binding/glycosyltransferase family 2 protein [Rhodopila sp.]HVZ09263.1 molybdopterin-binding/glycosyltransferase family 2 protein [Rhodopila sp.]
MRFGSAPLDEARGAIMAHSQRIGERMIRKGSLLDETAIAALREAGQTEVICARLDPGDVPEDIAADRLATPLVAPLIARSRAATGRVNLVAEAPGLLRVDAGRIDGLNMIDEAITIGTLPDYAVVAPKDLVATIKIIPFAVPGTTLSVAEAIARQGPPPLALHPFRPLKVGLVVTKLPGLKDSTIEKTVAVTQQRVARLTGSLLSPEHRAHEEAAIADGLEALIAQGADLLMVVGASAVVDRRDVGPAAIVRAGGQIMHFGMPVDPGNLICLGRIGDRPALVLPGCARSPSLNGIDFVLTRLFAGLPVTGRDLMRLGVGGLLKEMETRPMPREKAPATPRSGVAPRSAPTIAAIVMAAGRSRRMAPHNKLLVTDRGGKPMIARVVDNVLSSNARPILVVTGHMADQVEAALGGRPVRYVHAADYADGLSASLKAGIAAVPPESAAALVCLGDMPLVTGRMIDRLLSMYDPHEGRLIVLPTFRGKQGNPMIWDRRFFPEILEISGDSGARFLVGKHAEAVCEVEMGDDAVLRDFDTTEALATLPKGMRPAIIEN